jgi:hypothetical protein
MLVPVNIILHVVKLLIQRKKHELIKFLWLLLNGSITTFSPKMSTRVLVHQLRLGRHLMFPVPRGLRRLGTIASILLGAPGHILPTNIHLSQRLPHIMPRGRTLTGWNNGYRLDQCGRGVMAKLTVDLRETVWGCVARVLLHRQSLRVLPQVEH